LQTSHLLTHADADLLILHARHQLRALVEEEVELLGTPAHGGVVLLHKVPRDLLLRRGTCGSRLGGSGGVAGCGGGVVSLVATKALFGAGVGVVLGIGAIGRRLCSHRRRETRRVNRWEGAWVVEMSEGLVVRDVSWR
jgi:hypothetical protein